MKKDLFAILVAAALALSVMVAVPGDRYLCKVVVEIGEMYLVLGGKRIESEKNIEIKSHRIDITVL